MAKFKFIDSYENLISVYTDVLTTYDKNDEILGQETQICICIDYGKGNYYKVFLDKSTAIKFAKTLRTEINKITESEVNNG